jgi:hypothetical protein
LLQPHNWELRDHPSYCPDLASSDYHLFGPLKQRLEFRRFRSKWEVEMAFREWLRVLLCICTATYCLNFCQDGADALMWSGIMLKNKGTWLELMHYV